MKSILSLFHPNTIMIKVSMYQDAIDITSAEAFVRSLTEIGEAEIISTNFNPIV